MARAIKKRQEKYRVAIVGEGETEWHYFDNLRTEKKYSFQISPELPKHSDYESIFQKAEKLAQEGYDEVFCILDLDVFGEESKRQKYEAKKAKLLKNHPNIQVFETMPCLELWFLLHFKDYSSKIYNNCSEVILDLKKYIPDYEKKEDYFRKVKLYKKMTETGDLDKAKASAQKLCEEKTRADNPKFPFTEVYSVLSLLDSKSN